MTDADWISVSKFFKREEFDCPGVPGSGNEMSLEFMKFLYTMRGVLGFPLVVSKGGGYRTQEYQEAHGATGNGGGDHPQGTGADLKCEDSHKRFMIVRYAIENEIKRIEVCNKHIHIGYSTTLPQEVLIWGVSK